MLALAEANNQHNHPHPHPTSKAIISFPISNARTHLTLSLRNDDQPSSSMKSVAFFALLKFPFQTPPDRDDAVAAVCLQLLCCATLVGNSSSEILNHTLLPVVDRKTD